MNKKKTLMVLICYETFCGGETKATESIYNQLRKRTDIQINCYTALPLLQTNSNYFFIWIFNSITYWIRIIWNHRKANWVYTTTFTAGVAAILLKPISTYNIAWHFHGTRIPPSGTGFKGKTFFTQTIKYHIVYFLHRLFLSYTQIVFVPATFSKRILCREFPFLPSQRITIVPNGVDLREFKPLSKEDRELMREHYYIDHNQKVLLYVGRIEQKKNIRELIQVIYHLQQKVKNIILIIAYPKVCNNDQEKYLKDIQQLAKMLHLTKAIRWFEDFKDIPALYNVADITVSLSSVENFPLTLLEAWATKTLYISRPAGNTSELLSIIDKQLIIHHRDLVDITYQILSIIQLSQHVKENFTNKAFDEVQKFTWESSGEAIYHALSINHYVKSSYSS